MKRVWKPLYVNGLRLYQVNVRFQGHRDWNYSHVVAARSPSHAAELLKKMDEGSVFEVQPTYKGTAFAVLQPAEWTE